MLPFTTSRPDPTHLRGIFRTASSPLESPSITTSIFKITKGRKQSFLSHRISLRGKEEEN